MVTYGKTLYPLLSTGTTQEDHLDIFEKLLYVMLRINIKRNYSQFDAQKVCVSEPLC